jgi:hypothetical protein|tara:strand:+ start:3072 stop:3350 length:279 start_codon:yes stop_codon:yes gene_type:complete
MLGMSGIRVGRNYKTIALAEDYKPGLLGDTGNLGCDFRALFFFQLKGRSGHYVTGFDALNPASKVANFNNGPFPGLVACIKEPDLIKSLELL